ncbi:hypothetical protein CYMTET_45191 [Cymbomonas tetramitiformis]|uniref:ADP-ribosylhydrolase ARH3 n=1 Tax=Cymbomonas tetramitiformis TaxID=36881 RepID=A0AAE0EZX6_9CHLO|nr:hypothetical protein CYMTET_45191 [Cymbomonas tetramitiformis]
MDPSIAPRNIQDSFSERRAKGCALGLMLGDSLGAGCEGWPAEEIQRFAQDTWNSNKIEGFFEAVHMGTFVSAGQPGQYRPATELEESSFVPTGPPSNEAVAKQCARRAMYTDDTNQALALAASILENDGVDADFVAQSYAKAFQREPYRGVPPSSKRVMGAIIQGEPARKTGLPPYFPFAGGSFANGGAMKISLLSIPYRNAQPPVLRTAVEQAILSTHRHPEAIDFAVAQAATVQYCLRSTPETFDPIELLSDLIQSRCTTEPMCSALQATRDAYCEHLRSNFVACNDHATISAILKVHPRPGSGMSFQIASVHMAPCVMWILCRYYGQPLAAVQAAISLGGDTDTLASMVGAAVGALHGEDWCKPLLDEMENGLYGRDYAIELACKLSLLDLGASSMI